METQDKARQIVLMTRAHQAHNLEGGTVTRARTRTGCSGISDPLTGHFCQFVGTGSEQYEHQVERVGALLESQEER